MAEEYFSLHLEKRFARTGRQIKNIGGQLVVFEDGIAKRVDQYVADLAKRLDYIGRIIRHADPTPVVASVEAPEQKEEPEETSDEEQVAPEAEETQASIEDATKDEIAALYEEKGTWSAVADYYGTTTTTLKKYRDEFGL